MMQSLISPRSLADSVVTWMFLIHNPNALRWCERNRLPFVVGWIVCWICVRRLRPMIAGVESFDREKMRAAFGDTTDDRGVPIGSAQPSEQACGAQRVNRD